MYHIKSKLTQTGLSYKDYVELDARKRMSDEEAAKYAERLEKHRMNESWEKAQMYGLIAWSKRYQRPS